MDEQSGNTNIIIAIVLVALLIGGFFLFMSYQKDSSTEDLSTEETSFGGELVNRTQKPVEDAAKSVPETNPLGNVKANPYEGYKNPFAR